MLLYAVTIFLSSFLLFQIQPMISKMILPWFGGSAAVWITAMLFFQTALLGGYFYAHWSIQSVKPRTQAILHTVLLGASLLLLPVMPSPVWKPTGIEDPIFRIVALLTLTVGLPYLLLSTTSPLIQAWYVRKHRTALPYRLFGLSNLASLLGLLAYPVVVEPYVTLQQQSLGWSFLYVVFAALGITAALAGRKGGAAYGEAPAGRASDEELAPNPPGLREKVLWLLLAACASMLLLAVTNHLMQNVASIPFLWVLPLSLYLFTFVLTFDFERLYRRKLFIWLAIAALGGMAYGLTCWNAHTNLRIVIPAFSAGLFLLCMFCHGELVRRKPEPRYLTSFYLMLSAGGALGGLLIGLAAPKFLPGYFELPIALVLCALLLLSVLEYWTWRFTIVISFAVAAGVIFAAGTFISAYRDATRVMVRNFYGGLRVQEYYVNTKNEARILVHGTVDHGMEYIAPERRREHITYYGPGSGIDLAINAVRHPRVRMGVIGLGAGSLASYAEPGDVIRFYEINPSVEQLARTEFYYLPECRGTAEVILGDGRLSLERESAQAFDLLAVDAFSGDAVPVHLLTKQALELYFKHLKPDGILALHITNTHLDLAPVVEKLASALGKEAVLIEAKMDRERTTYNTRWALLSSSPITSPAILAVAREIPARPELRVWTDDYNNLFQILK